MMKKSNRNAIIEFMRLTATIGVFTGHFFGMGDRSIGYGKGNEILCFLRGTGLGKTPFAFLYEGDISVIFFFVISGFFIGFSSIQMEEKSHTIIKRIIMIVSPAIIMTVIHALCAYAVLRDVNFVITHGMEDIRKILGGGDGLFFSYQLWFVYYVVCGNLLLYSFLFITEGHKRVQVILLILLIAVYSYRCVGICEVLIGGVCGIVCKSISKKEQSKWPRWALDVIPFTILVCPMIYNEYALTCDRKYIVAFIMSISTGAIVINPRTAKILSNRGLTFLERLSYPIYITHALLFQIIGKIYKNCIKSGLLQDSVINVLILFALSSALLVTFSFFFKKQSSMVFPFCLKKSGE